MLRIILIYLYKKTFKNNGYHISKYPYIIIILIYSNFFRIKTSWYLKKIIMILKKKISNDILLIIF